MNGNSKQPKNFTQENSKFMKCVGLIVFCVGGGSKLLQSQLDGVNNISSIPGYPLKYFYKHWDEWKKHKLINSNLALNSSLNTTLQYLIAE